MNEGEPMEARAILEIAKSLGRVEIMPYHLGRIISLDATPIRVDKMIELVLTLRE